MKKPSEPSLIGSLTSYISLVPSSFANIQHSIHMLIPTNTSETTSATNAIKLGVELDMNKANSRIAPSGTATQIPIRLKLALSPRLPPLITF